MKRILAGSAAVVVVGGLLLAATTNSQSPEADPVEVVREQFVGNWELARWESFNEAGEATAMNYVGRIMYDASGNMIAILMPRDLPERPRAPGEPPPRDGFAYFSTVDIDVEEERVIHHVQGSPTTPGWVGTDLVRYYEISDDTLALSIRNDEGRVTGTLTWRRISG